MGAMNQQELGKLIREQTLPLIKEAVSSEVADVVEASVSEAISPLKEQQSDWVSKLTQGASKADERIREKGESFGRVVRALAHTNMNYGQAVDVLKTWGDDDLAKVMEDHYEKALAVGEPTAGGFLVPESFSQDIIELLRPASAVTRLNPTILPMPNGTFQIPKQTAGVAGVYIGENTNMSAQQPTFGTVGLRFRKLAVLVPMSNDLLRYSSPGADSIVRNDIVRGMAQRMNQALLRDNGTDATPKGLRNWAPAANVIAANGTVNLANITVDLGKLIVTLLNNDIPMTRPGWIMAPRTWNHLMTIQTTTGQFVFRQEMQGGTLWGWPFALTTQVPINLTDGGGTDESEIYLCDFADAVLGEAQNLIVSASDTAAYHDGSNVVAAFSQDQFVVRAIQEHDFVMRREESVAVLNEVTWGA
jgi:HK97 family phage major capsid protein